MPVQTMWRVPTVFLRQVKCFSIRLFMTADLKTIGGSKKTGTATLAGAGTRSTKPDQKEALRSKLRKTQLQEASRQKLSESLGIIADEIRRGISVVPQLYIKHFNSRKQFNVQRSTGLPPLGPWKTEGARAARGRSRAPHQKLKTQKRAEAHSGTAVGQKVVLSLASPFFKALFSLKQPPGADEEKKSPEGLPIIEVQEDEETLENLLRLCYPIADPQNLSLTTVGHVLQAAIKYEMEQPTTLMKRVLRECVDTQPLRAFAVACRLNMEEEAFAAARSFRTQSGMLPETTASRISPVPWTESPAAQIWVPEMSEVTAGAYYRLLHFTRGHSITTFCDTHDCFIPDQIEEGEPVKADKPTFDQEGADVIVQSSDGATFRVHKSFLSFASPVLKQKLIADAIVPRSSKNKSTPLPILHLPQSGRVLAAVLQFCYPMEEPDISESRFALELLNAAVHYEIKRAIKFIQNHLRTCSDISPVRLFFLAVRFGWHDEAQQYALRLVYSMIDDIYVSEMEFVPAHVYYGLLKFHFECQKRVAHISHSMTGFVPRMKYLREDAPVRRRGVFREIADMVYQPVIDRTLYLMARRRFPTNEPSQIVDDSERLVNDIDEALQKMRLELGPPALPIAEAQ
ncbi:hypothetical protein K474DRAFT_1699240 [Panus rudis PR-1116 ss-1]|nr:hypothetical protein K474DRAFT_1699240 [Panus rudis PR-1116 ss-1]